MTDRSLLFLLIIVIVLCIYRVIVSILLLTRKKYIIDEKFYIAFLYYSLVGILVFFTDWLIVGIILACILPIILTLYVAFAPSRKYWIINGNNLTESTFMNKLIEYDNKLQDVNYRKDHFRFSRKKDEKRTKIEFINYKYDEKEKLLNIVKQILKANVTKSNKKEIKILISYCILILLCSIFILITLFT